MKRISRFMESSSRPIGALLLVACMVLFVFVPIANAADTDGDGFEDHTDDCPVAEGNCTVDRSGCPDRDGDGTRQK